MTISTRATTITVTNRNDSGSGSLRQALVDGNDGDTITFAVTGTIVLTSGDGGWISGGGIMSNCTIIDNGAGGGENNFPAAGGGINGGGIIGSCTISDTSVFGSPAKGPALGGGIYAAGTVTISNSTFS